MKRLLLSLLIMTPAAGAFADAGPPAKPAEKAKPKAPAKPVKDYDKDGVPDLEDDCPTDPGNPKNKGCPGEADPELVELTSDTVDIKKRVEFETASAKLRPSATEILNAVGAVIRTLGDDKIVMVRGHTDSQGSKKMNMSLSKRRAASVVAYLTKVGIKPDRLRSEGLGPTEPIASNETPEGRAQNRRVEFRILDRASEAKK